ncbi:NAD(P)H-binding protein [Nocardia wallacei]|nr:NAD(P)H-binding protein [Nocardia wallacei]
MLLVTGATGVIGRRLIENLTTSGQTVRAVSRQPAPGLPDTVDLFSPDAIEAAITGVECLFVHPRATKDHIGGLLKLATAAGVGRVVVMSAINADDPPDHQPSRYNGDRNTETEQAVIDSGLPWVSVRPSSFAMNTLTMWRTQVTGGDTIFGPYAQFSEAVIHERDVAEVIARATFDDTLLGRRIPITGPEALTVEHMVTLIGHVIGKSLRYQEIPADVAARAMIDHGLDDAFVNALLNRYARELERKPTITHEVESILGRPARSFATWVADHHEAWA